MKRMFFLFSLSVILSSLFSGQAAAQGLCQTCEIYIQPSARGFPLPLEGLVVAEGDLKTVTIVDQADYGVWANDFYTITDSTFWAAGIDRLELNVTTYSGQNQGPKTVLFMEISNTVTLSLSMHQDFNGDLGNWTQVGDANSSAVATGRLVVGAESNQTAGMQVVGWDGQDNSTHDVENTGYIVLDADAAGGGPTGDGTGWPPAPVMRTSTDLPGDDLRVPVDYLSGNENWFQWNLALAHNFLVLDMRVRNMGGVLESEARSSLNPAFFDSNSAGPLATDWAPVSSGVVDKVRAEYMKIALVQGEWIWALRFSKRVGLGFQIEEEVFPKDLLPGASLGGSLATGGIGGLTCDGTGIDPGTTCGAQVFVESVSSTTTFSSFSLPSFVQRSFDTNLNSSVNVPGLTYEGQSAYGTATQVTLPSNATPHGINIDLMNLQPELYPSGWNLPPAGSPSRAALTLNEPDGETEVVVSTRVETELAGGQEFPAWSSLFLLEMGSQEGSTHIGPVEIRLRSESRGVRSLKMRVYLPGEVRETAWIQTQNPGFDLTVRWKADNTGGVDPNGFATMIVDNTPVTLGSLDNGDQTVDFVSVGAWMVRHTRLPISTQIPVFIDGLSMTYSKLVD